MYAVLRTPDFWSLADRLFNQVKTGDSGLLCSKLWNRSFSIRYDINTLESDER